MLFMSTIIKAINLKKSSAFYPINSDNAKRKCDPFGCGHFGASRGSQSHKGIDFTVTKSEKIKAPFDCQIIRYGFPYADDKSQELLEIKGLKQFSSYTAKIMYIKPLLALGSVVKKGATLCLAGDISEKFGATMTPHVHFELYENGELVNPDSFF